MVCLIQPAGATYSSRWPGQALQRSANIFWGRPPNRTVRRRFGRGSGLRVQSPVWLSARGRGISVLLTGIHLLVATGVLGTPEVRPKFARINRNLETRSTTNSIYLLLVREVVPMERISTYRVSHGSTVRPGIVAIFVSQWKWLRTEASVAPTPAYSWSVWTSARNFWDHATGLCRDWLTVVGCVPY